ncbi:hypothetical protein ACF3DV_32910 [Chlorogloeopsis fritschii PCC 9212]|uniref:Uncharacterized protein n=1 Tax=Chlorogloeopsis fritschii PCC 6912 TaxID=211165 RepID=A0A433MYV6_CHLFR|nr:hypothetical protein [Chlorogloeopsis fritschii]MBF2009281.1 hypothetical protein [Chlorogloeopsis fritschii C42_A2020_084]RUR73492.1 hypothetical protein PCC6912_56630 [Chlorogloeopsis fritschii PCC 6912]
MRLVIIKSTFIKISTQQASTLSDPEKRRYFGGEIRIKRLEDAPDNHFKFILDQDVNDKTANMSSPTQYLVAKSGSTLYAYAPDVRVER